MGTIECPFFLPLSNPMRWLGPYPATPAFAAIKPVGATATIRVPFTTVPGFDPQTISTLHVAELVSV